MFAWWTVTFVWFNSYPRLKADWIIFRRSFFLRSKFDVIEITITTKLHLWRREFL